MDFHKKSQRIRNKIKRYSTESIVERCLAALHDHTPVGHEAERRPWIYCLLLDWAIELAPVSEPLTATQSNVRNIAQDLWDLSFDATNITAGSGYRAPLRKMFIPQLRFQVHHNVRAFFLFRFGSMLLDHMNNRAPAEDFKGITGFSLERFFVFALWLQVFLSQMQTPFISYATILVKLYPYFTIHEIANLLKLVGGTVPELTITVNSLRNSERNIHASEYFDEPLLINRPVILLADGISTPHQHVLDIGISEFVLRTLKTADPARFRNKFTTSFENYIYSVFREHQLSPMREGEIKELYEQHGYSGKLVDFYLYDGGSNLFVDAKGVEPKPGVLTTVSGRFIRDQLRDFHFKGIDQIAECIEKLQDINFPHLANYEERFGLIITHQDFYVGDAVDLADYLEQKHHDKLLTVIDGRLPLDNIFFSSAGDFEGILKACSMAGFSITDFLKYCREQQKSAVTRKFDMAQHITEFCHIHNLGHRKIGSAKALDIKKRLYADLTNLLRANRTYWAQGADEMVPEFVVCWHRLRDELFN